MSKLSWVTEKVKKHKKLTIVLLVVLVLTVAGTALAGNVNKKKEEMLAMMNQTQTSKVERRTLVNSVSATGYLTSVDSKEIKVALSGVEVTEVNVEIGDMVEEGQILCTFDSADIEEALAEAKTSLNVTAQKTQMDLAAAERNLADATEDYHISMRRANTDLGVAYNDYVVALEDVAEAEKEMIESSYSEMSKQAYEQALEIASSKLQAYDKQKRNVEDIEKNVENNVITKTDSLTTSQLNALSSGNNEEDQIEQYQQQLDDCTVEAPISGVISAVNIAAGDTYNGTGIVTIDDVSSFEVTTEIDEYDIAQIKKGQKVVIKTNATGDEELEGTVKIVSPKATAATTGNNVTYKVIISVDTPNEVLRMDMTAKLSIILDSKANVLTVPYEAVQEDEEGNYYVEVVDASKEDSAGDAVEKENGNKGNLNKANMPKGSNAGVSDIATKRIFVEKGMESDYYIEIISADITEGMEVVVPKSNDDFNSIQNMMRMQGPMGGF